MGLGLGNRLRLRFRFQFRLGLRRDLVFRFLWFLRLLSRYDDRLGLGLRRRDLGRPRDRREHREDMCLAELTLEGLHPGLGLDPSLGLLTRQRVRFGQRLVGLRDGSRALFDGELRLGLGLEHPGLGLLRDPTRLLGDVLGGLDIGQQHVDALRVLGVALGGVVGECPDPFLGVGQCRLESGHAVVGRVRCCAGLLESRVQRGDLRVRPGLRGPGFVGEADGLSQSLLERGAFAGRPLVDGILVAGVGGHFVGEGAGAFLRGLPLRDQSPHPLGVLGSPRRRLRRESAGPLLGLFEVGLQLLDLGSVLLGVVLHARPVGLRLLEHPGLVGDELLERRPLLGSGRIGLGQRPHPALDVVPLRHQRMGSLVVVRVAARQLGRELPGPFVGGGQVVACVPQLCGVLLRPLLRRPQARLERFLIRRGRTYALGGFQRSSRKLAVAPPTR